MDLKDKIRVIEDFPIKGISFKDITTIISDCDAFRYTIDELCIELKNKGVKMIVAPESRGFIYAAPIAYALGVGFAPVRKKGKLPAETISITYDLEYGSGELEIHKDAFEKGTKIAIIDDLLATGGTILAVAELVEKLGGEVVSIAFPIELTGLKGREKLKKYDVFSLVQYEF
ncbi:MAG: adenine phosphoribosyltransferase [Oscillospiraceae bacterium]|nr:adenine phosphoribosyltransferase [Oscillospiraceae bacterium]